MQRGLAQLFLLSQEKGHEAEPMKKSLLRGAVFSKQLIIREIYSQISWTNGAFKLPEPPDPMSGNSKDNQ